MIVLHHFIKNALLHLSGRGIVIVAASTLRSQVGVSAATTAVVTPRADPKETDIESHIKKGTRDSIGFGDSDSVTSIS